LSASKYEQIDRASVSSATALGSQQQIGFLLHRYVNDQMYYVMRRVKQLATDAQSPMTDADIVLPWRPTEGLSP
jgi:hypothetical protein